MRPLTQLTRSITKAEERGRLGSVIELRILRSLALCKEGRYTEAPRQIWKRRSALAEPEGYARIFLDEGQPMQALIERWLANAGKSPLREYAEKLLSQFEAEEQANYSCAGKQPPRADWLSH